MLTSPADPYTIKLLDSVPRAEAGWLAGHGALSTGPLSTGGATM